MHFFFKQTLNFMTSPVWLKARTGKRVFCSWDSFVSPAFIFFNWLVDEKFEIYLKSLWWMFFWKSNNSNTTRFFLMALYNCSYFIHCSHLLLSLDNEIQHLLKRSSRWTITLNAYFLFFCLIGYWSYGFRQNLFANADSRLYSVFSCCHIPLLISLF